jgi:hypothetical protein
LSPDVIFIILAPFFHLGLTTSQSDLEIKWGLWQVCCTTAGEINCLDYTRTSSLAAHCLIAIPKHALTSIRVAQAMGVIGSVLVLVATIMNTYAAFQVCRAI